MKAKINTFSDSMQKILHQYGDDVRETARQLVKRAGEEARKKLKQVPPTPKKTGEYAKGWAIGDYTWSVGGAEITVYNKDKPGLAHLLENGHVLRRGGRTLAHSPVQPKPHIKPVEEEVGRELEKWIVQAIENGS